MDSIEKLYNEIEKSEMTQKNEIENLKKEIENLKNMLLGNNEEKLEENNENNENNESEE